MKNLAGQSSSSSKILEKLWQVFVMKSSSGAAYQALTTGKPKQTLLSNFQEFLDEEELCPARFFIDFMLQNIIQNWKMKNFHEKS